MEHRPRRMRQGAVTLCFAALLVIAVAWWGGSANGYLHAQEPAQGDGNTIWLPLVGDGGQRSAPVATTVPTPTPQATSQPTSQPTTQPTAEPTAQPTQSPGGSGYQGRSRQEATELFRTLYLPAVTTPLGFEGDAASCVAGTTSAARNDALLKQVNYFRTMAGVNPVTYNAETSALARAAAVIMVAIEDLTHNPTSDMPCYTEAGYKGASSSNLSLRYGSFLADPVSGQMEDDGPSNIHVGHRYWLLRPHMQTVGFGEVIGSGSRSMYAGAVYVTHFDYSAVGWGPLESGVVAWPPPGYVPWDVLWERWSASFPRPINLDAAKVEMWVDGDPQPVEIINRGGSFGTLVWVPTESLALAAGAGDELAIRVRISGVDTPVEAMREFEYSLILFTPE